MHIYDAVVIGAGQAGLSASYHLRRLGVDHVVLDADPTPGGAWQHRWDSLTMHDVHGVADLPDAPAPRTEEGLANRVIPRWFADYERDNALPVLRPVRVDRVESVGDLLVVHAGKRSWTTRTLVNATGTWTRPFVPAYPGAETFTGEQLHTVDYPGAEHFRGKRVLVVGGGASAVQFLGELAPLTEVVWVTRRPPVWREEWGEHAGREAITLVQERVAAGLPPASVVSVTGLGLRPQEQEAARLGVYDARRPMFERIEPDGVRWADGTFERVDAILWATGFRPAVSHLAPLHLRSPLGGIALASTGRDVQTAVTSKVDPRVHLVGYGPSASTIGGNRAGRAAAVAVRRYLASHEVALPGREVALSGREVALTDREVALSGREVALSGREVALSGRDVAHQHPAPSTARSAPSTARSAPSRPGSATSTARSATSRVSPDASPAGSVRRSA